VSAGLLLANETELIAWLVLRAANRTQAKGSTVRLVVPRASEVADELGIKIAEQRIVAAEEWLLDGGYLAPDNIGLVWDTYTITPVGLGWLRGGMPQPLVAPRKATEDAPGARPPSGGADAPAASERVPWWRRGVFGI
jgi:hypothetical protein